MNNLVRLMFFVACYLIGSIPTGVWYSTLFHKQDVRELGSNNSGATNIGRNFGAKAAVTVGIIDAFKGIIPMWIAQLLFSQQHVIIMSAGLLAIIGHAYPIFAQFKGGKVVATSIGVLIGYHFFGGLTMLAAFLLLMFLTSTVSLSALVSYGLTAILLFFIAPSKIYGIGFVVIDLLMIYRHKDNIQRLLKGEEKRINWGLRKPN